jgi:hypothetical protein
VGVGKLTEGSDHEGSTKVGRLNETDGRLTEGRLIEGRLTEGKDNEGSTKVGRPNEIDGKLTEGRDIEGSTNVGRPNEIDGKLTEGRDIEGSTKVGRPNETDGKLTDKVGKDADPRSTLGKFVVIAPTRSLIERVGRASVGTIVDGTESMGEIEGSDRLIEGKVGSAGKVVETPVGSEIEGNVICEGIDNDKPLTDSPVVAASSNEETGKLGMPPEGRLGNRSVMGKDKVAEQRPSEPLPV